MLFAVVGFDFLYRLKIGSVVVKGEKKKEEKLKVDYCGYWIV